MLNPGYKAQIRDYDFDVDAGRLFLCPGCKKPLMNAVVERFYVRCKHCGKWVYIYKKVEGGQPSA